MVVPDDLLERKRNVLLGFVLNDLSDFAGVNRGQFDEFGENVETRRANVDVPGFDPLLRQEFLKRLLDRGFPGGLLRSLRSQRPESVLLQPQSTGVVYLELGQLEAARPKINRQK